MNVKKELRRLIRDAVYEVGGSGGRRQCSYCLRESYRGQPQHYRVEFKGEADEHCAVDVMRAALKKMASRTPGNQP